MFSATVYQDRRKGLLSSLEKGLILIMGNEESPMNYPANPYHFRQDSNFLYYTGIDSPGHSLLIDLEEGKSYLAGPEPDIHSLVWTGPQPSLSEQAGKAGISFTMSYADLKNKLAQVHSQGGSIHILPPYRSERVSLLSDWLSCTQSKVLQLVSRPLIKAVISQRSIKETREVEEMAKAVNLTNQMHLAIMKHALEGKTEAEVGSRAYQLMYEANCELAYPMILTINGQFLHNHAKHHTLQKGQMLLFDVGASAPSNYAADLTRTVPVGLSFSSQQRDIYQIVLQAFETAEKALKPGIPYQQIHLEAAKVMVEGLKSLGIMKGNTEAAVKEGAHAMFFPHGLGHMIGLDVHDMEDLGEDLVGYDQEVQRSSQFGMNALRLGRELQKGFALTVEPGVYFIPDLIHLWESEKKHVDFINYSSLTNWMNFGGVRIEDDFLITDSSSLRIGDSLIKQISEIEALIA
ncbi:MAG: aminopeptidase P family protein [Bacteroidota bacterium]